ncbi:MAG: hypothetical protein R6X13_09335 [bacterium]
MNRTTVLATLVALTALALAGAPWADPANDPFATRVTALPEVSGPPDGEVGPTGTSTVLETGEVNQALIGPGSSHRAPGPDLPGTLEPFLDWGNDQLVDSLGDLPTWGKIVADVAPNGDIYLGVLDPDDGAVNDSIFFYRSTNGGMNWTYLNFIGGPSGDIRDFTLRVGGTSDTAQVYAFVVYDGAAGIYVRRAPNGISPVQWTQIVAADSVLHVSADRNVETPQHLFCSYEYSSGGIKLVSSADRGSTWGNLRNVMSNSSRPSVAAGADGYVYITYVDRSDSFHHRVGRYTNNLISPSFVFNWVDSTDDNRHRQVSIAAARTTPGGSQTAVILTTVRTTINGNIYPRYSWTRDGGTSWSSSFWPPTNQTRTTWRMHGPDIRVAYLEPDYFRAIVSVPEVSWDSIVYAFAGATSPNDWTGRGTHNDHRATGEFGATVGVSSQTGGGFIAYREWASSRIWFDGWDFTGVAELPNPARPTDRVVMPLGGREVRLSLGSPARVRATVVDASGRTRSLIHDGALAAGDHRLGVPALARGVYFVNLDVAGARHQGKLIITD